MYAKRTIGLKRVFKTLFWIWLVLFVALLYAPKLPTVRVSFLSGIIRIDYLSHIFFNFVLIFLLLLWKSDNQYRITIQRALIIFVLGIAFGFTTEFTQSLVVVGRSREIEDLICNISGVLLGLIVYSIIPIGKILTRHKS